MKLLPNVNIDRAHNEISARAAVIANQQYEIDTRLDPSIRHQYEGFFVPAEFKIGLELRQGVIGSFSQDIIDVLYIIGRESIRKAIVDKGELFVGLILGEARKKRNYFDVYYN